MSITEVHDLKTTLSVEVYVPGHEERTETALFRNTKKQLMVSSGGRCFICNRNVEESGHPMQSHHHPIERSEANAVDWRLVAEDCKTGMWGIAAQAFDWDKFFIGATTKTVVLSEEEGGGTYELLVPVDPILFVDDQTVNGVILCADHHIGKDEGIHNMPYPLWIAQKYAYEGYKFSDVETITHGK